MNQKLSNWASIAEIVASLAVIITLVVLIIGVRENTEIVRASAYADNLKGLSDWQMGVLSDPDAMRVWTSFMDSEAEDLVGIDRRRLDLILLTQFRTYESAFWAERRGLLGEEEWNRFRRSICEFYDRAEIAGRTGPILGTTTDQFVQFISDGCID